MLAGDSSATSSFTLEERQAEIRCRPFRWGWRRSQSTRLHSTLADDRRGLRRSEEFQQRFRRRRFARGRVKGGGKHRDVLDIGRQRSDVLDALVVQKLADLLKAELDLAALQNVGDLYARRRLL